MLLWEIPKVDRKRSLREVLTEWLHGKLFAMATTEGRFVDKQNIHLDDVRLTVLDSFNRNVLMSESWFP